MTPAARILPAEAVQAYVTSGLKPIRKEYTSGVSCGCPVAALYFVAHRFLASDAKVCEWARDKYGMNYEIGFTRGVDGKPPYFEEVESPETLRGRADGSAAWQAVLAAVADGTIKSKGDA